jgi:hypothetical protein
MNTKRLLFLPPHNSHAPHKKKLPRQGLNLCAAVFFCGAGYAFGNRLNTKPEQTPLAEPFFRRIPQPW